MGEAFDGRALSEPGECVAGASVQGGTGAQGLGGGRSTRGSTDVVVSDVIPYRLWLLLAGNMKHALLRPMSSADMLSVEEKLAFGAHVATLRALGLTYVKIK